MSNMPPSMTGAAGSAGAGMAGQGSANPGDMNASMAGSAGAAAGSDAVASGPDIPCPADATFCSGFEGSAFPAGTQFHSVGLTPPSPFAFDTAEAFAGAQSLELPSTGGGGFYYRALAVPVPGQDFWVRLHLRVSSVFGDGDHDSLFGASTGTIASDVNSNDEHIIELSEQANHIMLNTDDARFDPPDNPTISANTWHCMEAHYSGGPGDVQIFLDGTEVITAKGYKPETFTDFRIGYMRYNTDRTIWFDNVVVATNRVNCD
jgi:hypothetical protein